MAARDRLPAAPGLGARRARAAGVALGLGLILGPSGCSGPAPRPSVVVNTNMSTRYYAVRGTTAGAIFDEIEKTGLFEKSGQRATGLTSVDWKLASDGPCSTPSLTITVTLVVTLPQHEQPEVLPGGVRRQWERFAARVAAHEQRHVDIFLDGARSMKASMEAVRAKGSSCAEVEQAIDALWTRGQAEIDRAQEQFHVEDGAKTQAERGPLQTDLATNQARLAALDAEIRRPGVTREEHANLADEYNRLVAATNDLIEALNWTR
jgi:predicted secreted Zn-dependent protease